MTESDFDDNDLAALADDELVKQMFDDLYDGLGDEIVEGTTILLDRGWGPDKVLQLALDEGRHEKPSTVVGRNWYRINRQSRRRHGQGRHSRHWQKSCGDDA